MLARSCLQAEIGYINRSTFAALAQLVEHLIRKPQGESSVYGSLNFLKGVGYGFWVCCGKGAMKELVPLRCL